MGIMTLVEVLMAIGTSPPSASQQHRLSDPDTQRSYTKPSPLSRSIMSTGDHAAAIIGALGTLLGYIGAEVATDAVFERLLWPQRFFNHLSYRNALQIGLLMPMGGPLHRAALHTLDKFYRNELFKGEALGNMLGSAFFRDMGLKYTLHESCMKPQKEYVRNGLWVRAIQQMPIPPRTQKEQIDVEGGLPKPRRPVRARTAVSHLKLSDAGLDRPSGCIINHDTGPVTFRCMIAIFLSEMTGIAMGTLFAALWGSWFAVLWLLPLLLKLLSACFTIPREGLVEKVSSVTEKGKPLKIIQFVVHLRSPGFLVIEGEDTAVLQFFRHYGHPVRHRTRELIQFGIVILFGFVFPSGMLCALVWMPPTLQYLWLGYQLYATIVMHIQRYSGGHAWATTEERIARVFAKTKDGGSVAILEDQGGTAIKATLTRNYVNSYAEGTEFVEKILASKNLDDINQLQKEDRSDSNVSTSTMSILSVDSSSRLLKH